jgi:hypothetical protein
MIATSLVWCHGIDFSRANRLQCLESSLATQASVARIPRNIAKILKCYNALVVHTLLCGSETFVENENVKNWISENDNNRLKYVSRDIQG